MPVLVPVLIGMGSAAVATSVGATVVTAAVVGVGAAVISKKTGVADKIYEEIFKPVGDLVVDVVKSDLGNAVLKVAAVATGNTWAIPLIDGAKVAANGGDVGDVLKAAAISYVAQSAGDITGKFVTNTLVDAGASKLVVNTVVSGAKSAAKAMVYGQDPLKAFAQGGVTAAVSAGLGKVDEALRENYGETFENLDDKVKQSVFSGLRTELSGGDLTEGQVGDIIAKYTGASNVVNNFLKDNVGLTAEAAETLTRAVSNGVSVALAGGSGLDAFSGSLSAEGAAALKKIIDKPVYKAIDKVTGAYGRTETAANALTAQSEKANTARIAANKEVGTANTAVRRYNTLQAQLAGRIQTQDGLKGTYDSALAKYNGSKTQANADAVTAAIDAYNSYATNLESDYNNNYKDQMAGYKAKADRASANAVKLNATFKAENDKVAPLQEAYDDAMDWVVTETDNLDGVLKPKLVEVNKAVALTLRPNIDEDAYREMNGLAADADVYEHFLEQGQELPTSFESVQQTMNNARYDAVTQSLASVGVDFMSLEPEQMNAALALADKNLRTFNDIVNIDANTYLKAATDATPKGAAQPESFAKAAGVKPEDIANGKASLTNVDGVLTWVTSDYVIDPGEGQYGSIGFKFMGGLETTEPKTLTDMLEEARDDFKENGVTRGAVIDIVLDLGAEAGGALADSDLWAATKALHDHHVEYSPAGDARKNTASVILSAGGETLQAIAGLSVLAGANPNNALGRAAKNVIALSGDMKSVQWKADAAEMQANSAGYADEWRAANPGEEPSWAQKGYLKAAAIFGNIKDHPVQWVSENIVTELLQEIPILIVSGGTGNVAKRLMMEAGEAQAKKVAARVAIGTGITLDAAEAFGGTAAGAFDEAYSTALNSGMSDQEATDYAMDVAQKAGGIAVLTLAATAGIGGQALSKSLFGNKGTKDFVTSYDAIKAKVAEGFKVTIKEGVTEFVEEALPQLYIATSLVQIDPSYDVAGSVFEAGIKGKLTGAGTAGGIYTGNALADALLTTNTTVKDAVTNSGSSAKATQALKDLGISDTEVLNNLLNTTYDAQYVTTTEAGDMFTKENPGFNPTEAEIAALAGKKNEADLAANVAAYVDPRYLDADEVKAAAAAEGITLTDEQAKAYTGQKDEAGAVAGIREEYDPQATTRDEAEKFFADQGYDPTEEEITARVAAVAEADQKASIGEYVNPRQATEAEVRQAFADQSYDPTDAEVAERVGQGGDTFEADIKAAVEPYIDPRQVTATEATDAYAALGLANPTAQDIAAMVGQYAETELGGRVEKNLPTARFNYLSEQLDVFREALENGGVPSDQIEEMIAATREETRKELEALGYSFDEQLGSLGDDIADSEDRLTDLIASNEAAGMARDEAVQEAVSDLAEEFNVSQDELYNRIGETEASLNTRLDALDTVVEDLGTQIGEVEASILERVQTYEDAGIDRDTALSQAIGDVAADLGTTEDLLLAEIGTTRDELANQFTAGLSALETDLTTLIEQNDGDVDAALTQLASDLGTTEDSLLAEIGTTRDELANQFTEGLADVKEDVAGVQDTVTNIEDILGGPGIADDPSTAEDETQDPTGLFATINMYENAGLTRDEALAAAIGEVSTALGVTEGNLLDTIGETETSLLGAIGESETAVLDALGETEGQLSADIADSKTELLSLIEANEAAGMTRDEATQAAVSELATAFNVGRTELLSAIGETEASLISQITDVAATLGADIDVVADLIGKPAREVTQTDVDFVIDLLAQENVSAENVLQYDVTGDGILDINDQNMLTGALQGDQDVTFADTSMFNPATGLYLEQETDTQTQLDAITDMNTQINTQIQTGQREDNISRMMKELNASSDAMGQRVDVTTPGPMNIDYLYDISGDSVFATPQQAQLFGSPYGGTRAAQPTQTPANTTVQPRAQRRASGFAEGGQVEDENDMLLRILGDMQ